MPLPQVARYPVKWHIGCHSRTEADSALYRLQMCSLIEQYGFSPFESRGLAGWIDAAVLLMDDVPLVRTELAFAGSHRDRPCTSNGGTCDPILARLADAAPKAGGSR